MIRNISLSLATAFLSFMIAISACATNPTLTPAPAPTKTRFVFRTPTAVRSPTPTPPPSPCHSGYAYSKLDYKGIVGHTCLLQEEVKMGDKTKIIKKSAYIAGPYIAIMGQTQEGDDKLKYVTPFDAYGLQQFGKFYYTRIYIIERNSPDDPGTYRNFGSKYIKPGSCDITLGIMRNEIRMKTYDGDNEIGVETTQLKETDTSHFNVLVDLCNYLRSRNMLN